jgi:hypothetical protein
MVVTAVFRIMSPRVDNSNQTDPMRSRGRHLFALTKRSRPEPRPIILTKQTQIAAEDAAFYSLPNEAILSCGPIIRTKQTQIVAGVAPFRSLPNEAILLL